MKGILRIKTLEKPENPKSRAKPKEKITEYPIEKEGADVLINVDGFMFRIPCNETLDRTDDILNYILPAGDASLVVNDKVLCSLEDWKGVGAMVKLFGWLDKVQ